jgi:hypothetical protein
MVITLSRMTSPWGPQPPYGVDPVFGPPPPRRRGMSNGALLGIVLGVLVPAIVLAIIFLPRLGSSVAGPYPYPSPDVTFGWDPTEPPALDPFLPTLSIGQCITPIEGANEHPGSGIVDCATPHQGQVFEIIPIEGTTYPGETALSGKLGQCQARLSAYANMQKVKNMQVFILTPSQARWDEGDEAVYCVVGSKTALTKGSVSKYAA